MRSRSLIVDKTKVWSSALPAWFAEASNLNNPPPDFLNASRDVLSDWVRVVSTLLVVTMLYISLRQYLVGSDCLSYQLAVYFPIVGFLLHVLFPYIPRCRLDVAAWMSLISLAMIVQLVLYEWSSELVGRVPAVVRLALSFYKLSPEALAFLGASLGVALPCFLLTRHRLGVAPKIVFRIIIDIGFIILLMAGGMKIGAH